MKQSLTIGKMSKGQRKAHKATSKRKHGDWMSKLQNAMARQYRGI